jgi:hypothetical protein
MRLVMRVHGIERDYCDKEKVRIQLMGEEPGAVSSLFLRVTREALAPYGLGTLHTVTVEG